METWKYHFLEPFDNDSQSYKDSDNEEFHGATYAGHYDSLSDALTPGDKFAFIFNRITRRVLTSTI